MLEGTFYQTLDGDRFDLFKFNQEDLKNLMWLFLEYSECISWIGFETRTSQGVISYAQRNKEWQDSPLYKIQLDLCERKIIATGEASGKLNNFLIFEN